MSRDPIRNALTAWLCRLRLVRSLHWSAWGLVGGLAASGSILGYALLSRTLLAREAFTMGAAGVAAGFMIGLLAALLWPLSEAAAARRLDFALGLKERISTALELSSQDLDSALAMRQHEDAAVHASGIDPRRGLPFRLPRIQLLLALVLALAHVAGWSYAQDSFRAAQEKRLLRETIDAQIEEIEALIESIRNDPELTDEQVEALVRPLEEALQDLAASETLEEAFSALEEARESLQSLQDPAADAAADQLQQAAQAASGETGSPLYQAAQSLAAGDLEQAAEDLRAIDPAALDAAELDQLAEQLDALADAVAGVDPALANQLREAADAARNGEAAALEEALDLAAEAIEQIQQQASGSQAARQAAGQVGEIQEAIVAAGQGDSTGTPVAGTGDGQPGSGDQPGDSSGSGGENPGGSGSGSGSGSGTGSGTGADPGGQAGTDPISQGNDPDGSGESGFQPISPSSIGGEGSDRISVPPSGAEGGDVIGTGPSDSGSTAPITVPYINVLPQYQAAAVEAIDSGIIPAQFEDLVRDYFSSLEP